MAATDQQRIRQLEVNHDKLKKQMDQLTSNLAANTEMTMKIKKNTEVLVGASLVAKFLGWAAPIVMAILAFKSWK